MLKYIPKFLKQNKLDAMLLYGADDPNIFYITQFFAPDAVHALITRKQKVLIVDGFEQERAKRESKAKVITSKQLGYAKFAKKYDREKAMQLTLLAAAKKFKAKKIGIPKLYPAFLAELLKDKIKLEFADIILTDARLTKDATEIKKLKLAQSSNEKVTQEAIRIIKRARVRGNKLIYNSKPLTVKTLKTAIFTKAHELNLSFPLDMIVSVGKKSYLPHYLGKDHELIRPNTQVVLDIYPKHKNQYWGDMTRTVSKGKPSQTVIEMFNAVKDAQAQAMKLIRPKIKSSDPHNKALDVLNSHGFRTTEHEGFIHSLGHGIGLDMHEAPHLAPNSEAILKPGIVTSNEPGLYYKKHGGVRLEDLILIKKSGPVNLNRLKPILVL